MIAQSEMSSEMNRPTRFKRTLGLFDATAISVGAIIGAGIFVVTGIAAGIVYNAARKKFFSHRS